VTHSRTLLLLSMLFAFFDHSLFRVTRHLFVMTEFLAVDAASVSERSQCACVLE
jgi:hypothetical protein